MPWFNKEKNNQNDRNKKNSINSEHNSDEDEERQVDMNIQSIQRFYKLSSQKKLISLIVDKRASDSLFNNKQVMISSIFLDNILTQSQKQQKKIAVFAQKYTFEALVEKFRKPKAETNELLIKILSKKMQKQVIVSHQTRKNIWLLASGAKFNMINNKNLYEGLLRYDDYPKYFQRSISQDLHRTVNKQTSLESEDDIKKLKNVLTAFSRRNPYIGYCQGLNFIAFFLLTMQFAEEEAFFLLSTMLETIIPMDYYTNMIGVVCDQQVFINILKVKKPHIVQKFSEVGLDPSVLSIEWFVCLFTSSLPFYLVKIVWDRLLVEGTRAFIKTGLIILSYFQDVIMQTTEFHEIIMILQKGTKSLQVTQLAFNAQYENHYIDKKGLKIARDLYREYHIKQKLSQKLVMKKKKNSEMKCDLKWPICVVKIEDSKRQRQESDVWIYRTETPPRLIPNYLTNNPKKVVIYGSGSKTRKNKQSFSQTGLNSEPSKMSSDRSINPPSSDNESTENKQNSESIVGDQMQKPQSSVNRSFDSSVSPTKQRLLQINDPYNSSQLIIGRMDHMCSQSPTIPPNSIKNIKKNARKSDAKFLSMILQQSQPVSSQIEQKRAQTIKKIQFCSQIIGVQDDYQNTKQFELSNNKKLDKDQRAMLARSRTINFFNQFLQNNKQLSFILTGVEPKNIYQKNQEPNQIKSEQDQNREEKDHKETDQICVQDIVQKLNSQFQQTQRQ